MATGRLILGQTWGVSNPGDMAPDLRVSDEQRAQVVELLRTHTADGHLTLDEFSERVGLALASQTAGDLQAVTAGLPVPAASGGTPVVTRRKKVSRWIVAVMSGNDRKGRWRTGSEVNVVAVMGGCDIDFRQAEFESDEIVVTAVSVMGGISITVPEGIAVELTGFPILGGKQIKVADVPVIPGSPRIVVRAFPVMGGIEVRSKPNRTAKEAAKDAKQVLKQTASAIWQEMSAGDRPAAALPASGSDLHESILRQVNDKVAKELEKVERRNRRRVEQGGPGLPPRPTRPTAPGSAPRSGAGRVGQPTGGAGGGPGNGRPEWGFRPGSPPRERFAGVFVPGLGTYGLRWGMELEQGEDRNLPDDSELSAVPAAPDGTVTILFSDICGYTEMNERLGDRQTYEIVRSYQQIVRAQLAAYEGYEVKVQGDGFMVAFAGASRALRCAIAIQRVTDDWCKEHEEPIRIHQGMHTGETVRENGDFLGRTVILASRITGESKESEILASSVVKELAAATGEFRFGDPRDVQLKGVTVAQTVYPVEWRVG